MTGENRCASKGKQLERRTCKELKAQNTALLAISVSAYLIMSQRSQPLEAFRVFGACSHN